MTEPMQRSKTFTLWVAHPDRWVIADEEESVTYSHKPGWWRTTWTGDQVDADAYRARLTTG